MKSEIRARAANATQLTTAVTPAATPAAPSATTHTAANAFSACANLIVYDATPFCRSGICEMTASVVSSSDAIDAAFSIAERTTFVGSITPA